MAVTLDSTSRSSGTNVAAMTWNHTNNGDLLTVRTAYYSGAAERSTTITYAGGSLTRMAEAVQGAPGSSGSLELWYRRDPALGASTITFTFGESVISFIVAGAVSYVGSSGIGGYAASTGTSTRGTVWVYAGSGDDLVIDAESQVDSTSLSTAGSSQTAEYTLCLDNGGFGSNRHAGSRQIPSAASSVLFVNSTSRTITAAASTWSIGVGELRVSTRNLLVLGLGTASSAVTISAVSDELGNNWLQAVIDVTPLPAAVASLWYASSVSGSCTRVSVTLSGASSGGLSVGQFRNITGLDVTASSNITANSTIHSAAELTPSAANALVVSYGRMTASTIGTITPAANYTAWATTNAAGTPRTVGLYWIQAAASTATGAWNTSSNCQHSAALAAFTFASTTFEARMTWGHNSAIWMHAGAAIFSSIVAGPAGGWGYSFSLVGVQEKPGG